MELTLVILSAAKDLARRTTDPHTLNIWSIVDWLQQHILLTGLATFGLIAVTIMIWAGSRQERWSTPHPATTVPTQQSRNALVRRLRQEYRRRLTHSLQGAAMMALGLHERTDVTLSSAQFVFTRTGTAEEHPLPPGTSIVQVYDDAGQGLLILGEPGAGKTTLLLDLARELLARAEGDPTHPIPVILNLASWASKKPALTTWFIDQMHLIYQVPSHLSKSLLEQGQWLLLLDGLDEVEVSACDRVYPMCLQGDRASVERLRNSQIWLQT